MRFEFRKGEDGNGYILHFFPENKILSSFFETEIYDNLTFANHILALCEEHNSTSYEISGNLFNLLIKNDIIVIENLFDEEEKETLTRAAFQKILTAWIKKHLR